MNPPPHFPTVHPPRQPPPPQTYHQLPPPPPPYAAPNAVYSFNLPPSHHHYEGPSSSSATTSTTAAVSDLPAAVSTLTSLLHLTETTLNSISPLFPNSSKTLIPCPFNPNHFIPASSIFSHYLNCPSSTTPLSADDLLHSISYPTTLQSSLSSTPFMHHLENPNSDELCFSLENFLNFSNNFFYSDCPGPVMVNSSGNCNSISPPILTLSNFLYAECDNFTCTSEDIDLNDVSVESIRLFPSEIWAVGEEINGWGDYPASYSYRVLRAILVSGANSLLCLSNWVIVNSPKYSIIIDLAMRDHIVFLFKLCFKAVIREATKLASSLFTGEGEEKKLCEDKRNFDCPILSSVMRWLGFQVSVLYGERNGKFFAINMLKQCVLESALNSSVFPVVEKSMESPEFKGVDGKFEVPIENIEGGEENIIENVKGPRDCTISVSQVAAAVAALHERSWLERKIMALRDLRPVTAYQRMVEHEYISKRANDERKKRPDYRPVIEHDGLLFHRGQNLEPNRTKTREEILAEQRDYKRRRMSYRGKKMKRSTTQVMRDIIDEFMDEIEQASNVSKGDGERESGASVQDSSLDVAKSEKNQSTLQASRMESRGYGDHLHFHDRRFMDSAEKYLGDNKEHRDYSRQRHGLSESDRSIKRTKNDRKDYSRSPDQRHSGSDKSNKRARHYRKDYSRSPDKRRIDSHARGHISSRGIRNDPEITEEKFPQRSDRSRSMSYGKNRHHREENEHDSVQSYKDTRKRHWDGRSASSRGEFEDRYTPSELHDTNGDDT